MEFIWVLFAFGGGVLARLMSLPPLIGYLAAGFTLNILGFVPNDSLRVMSELGITIMLFTIGLKLKVSDLLKPEVWLNTFFNMSIWIVFIGLIFTAFTGITLHYLSDLTLQQIALITFALSFSSTVCVVKILEESGELKTQHGKLAIGVLITQDIIAVVFLVIATGVIPSIWAFGLLSLWLVRYPLGLLLDKSGHGELLPLTGFFLAFGGYELFYLVDVKGDLGALVFGVLLSGHRKSTELYKSLMGFKDLFLVGFFLSIGFANLPDLQMVLIALALVLLIPIKGLFYFSLLSWLKLRARTAYLSALVLSNYSEFGLIVMALCVSFGWLSNEWLVILALAVAFSFVFTSVIYKKSHILYKNYQHIICKFDSKKNLAKSTFNLPENAEILVIGMGRVGKGTYHSLCRIVEEKVCGLDSDEERVKNLMLNGYRLIYGDGEDADLWQQINLTNIKLILIALPYIQDIENIHEQLKAINYKGKIAAIARYEDQIERLSASGIDKIFNFYNEAGVGFAEESIALLEPQSMKA